MLADHWRMPLFEIRPDLFPDGFLTRTELDLWNLYFENQEKASGKI
jgi:hypothetical protein